MSLTYKNSVRLVARNEGKIKSYDSCSDIRAWSHDVITQDRYLREWIKADMPVCVIPARILYGFLKTMTCKSRRRATPRCHPDCKSKVLVDSICASCHAVKECLKLNENLEEYFVEEDIETSHWPCDRCLEALKSIKMFWKIIVSRIFNVNLTKCDAYESNCQSANSVKSVTKVWQNDILKQAFYVKKHSPSLSKVSKIFNIGSPIEDLSDPSRPIRSCGTVNNDCPTLSDTKTCSKCSRETYVTPRINKKVSKCTSVKLNRNDVGCDTCFIKPGCDEIIAYKMNINVLQDRCNEQNEELENLKNENRSLKIELDNVYKKCPWKASFYVPEDINPYHVTVLPKPFEAHLEESCPPKCIDSEMIITMKNLKNENYRHVSLLKVLHKTNDPFTEDIPGNGTCCKKEDPIVLLNKVQNTFGAIVKRELNIVNERKHRPKKTDVDATFHKVNTTRSDPSCSTISSRMSSETDFVSSRDFCCGQNIKVLHI